MRLTENQAVQASALIVFDTIDTDVDSDLNNVVVDLEFEQFLDKLNGVDDEWWHRAKVQF